MEVKSKALNFIRSHFLKPGSGAPGKTKDFSSKDSVASHLQNRQAGHPQKLLKQRQERSVLEGLVGEEEEKKDGDEDDFGDEHDADAKRLAGDVVVDALPEGSGCGDGGENDGHVSDWRRLGEDDEGERGGGETNGDRDDDDGKGRFAGVAVGLAVDAEVDGDAVGRVGPGADEFGEEKGDGDDGDEEEPVLERGHEGDDTALSTKRSTKQGTQKLGCNPPRANPAHGAPKTT